MLVAPYFLFVFSTNRFQHRKKVVACLSIAILIICAIVIRWYLQDKYESSVTLAKMAGQDINNVFDLLISNLKPQLENASNGLIAYITPVFNNIANVSSDLLRRMAGIYLIVCVIAYFKGFALSNILVKRIWLVFLATNLILLMGFSITNNISVSRYTLATSLTLLILAPFALNYWIEKLSEYAKDQRLAVYGTILLLAVISIKELDVRTNKHHLAEAGRWLSNEIEAGGTLYSNERLIVHYAKLGAKSNFVDLFTNDRMLEHLTKNEISQYDFIALSITHKNNEELEFSKILVGMFGEPIKLVAGENRRAVMIFSSAPKRPGIVSAR